MAGAQVVDVIPFSGIDRPLSYAVPDRWRSQLQVGSLVRIPLRRRSELGVVKELRAPLLGDPSPLKPIDACLYDRPVLNPALLRLATWLRTYYAASWEGVLEMMVPPALRQGAKAKQVSYVRLSGAGREVDLAAIQKKAPKQAEGLAWLRLQKEAVEKSKLLQGAGIAAGVVTALVNKGWVEQSQRRQMREAYKDALSRKTHVASEVVLNEEQRAAAESIGLSIAKEAFQVHLLHGVTGSGKTEVYIEAMARVLQRGGGVLFMVPEVALTPQTVERLRHRLQEYGEDVLVWHSHLSQGERHDAWLALAEGRARVVVGARSAVFAPVPNLQLIIVDEEHEPAFKQDETPRYHGRDVAVYRAHLEGIACVLGSATPSLETLYNAQQGKYILNRLLARVDDRAMPLIHVVDMRRDHNALKTRSPLSQSLVEKLRERLRAKEQSILFLNRRGYHAHFLCQSCGHVEMSPDCSLPLTYHRTDNTLRCHLTGFSKPAPRSCPQCGERKMFGRGQGTQRVEEAVQAQFPQARIVRMDTDSMSQKHLFRKILNDFRAGQIDILVGTQMIAKGLDFPNVTLVGIVDADLSLHVPDFRAAERTFQLVVQVSGRAGRGDREGEVVIQSYTPHAAPIQFARRGDFDGFLADELLLRKEFAYPPFRHLIRHVFRGRNEDKVLFYAEQWVSHLEKMALADIEVRGPAPAAIAHIKGEFRFQCWYFVPSVTRVIEPLRAALREFPFDREVIQVLDVDALSMM